MKRVFLSICIFPFVITTAKSQQPTSADMVILNGHVWTVDQAHPQAEAVAIHGNRIVAVGADAEIAKWVGPQTKKIDAQGKSVLPGFVDAHVHFSSGGGEISSVQLRDAATPQEFSRRITPQ
jgi:predicted amidohydrolase YtcJ